MRTGDYLAVALKDIRRQPLRTSLTLFALIISTVILVLMAAISVGGRQAITEQFGPDSGLTSIAVTPNQSNASLSPFGDVQEVNSKATKLDDATVATLAKLPHVASASPQAHIWELANFSLDGSDKQFVAQAEGVPSDAPLALAAGAAFTTNDQTNVAIIGLNYAKVLGFGDNPSGLIGKTINVTTQKGYRGVAASIPDISATKAELDDFNQQTTTLKMQIVGVTTTGPNQNGLFVPIGWAHAIRTIHYYDAGVAKQTDQIAESGYTTIKVTADSTANVASVSSAIEALGYGQVSTLSQVQRLQQLSATMWMVLGAVAIIAVIAAALGVVNTMLMAVSEQRYTIGVWRACGARRHTMVALFLTESALLGFIGGALGVAIGMFASRFVNEYVGVLLQNQGLTLANIAIVPPWLAGGTIMVTTIFGIIAGVYPAYRAARQDPVQALTE